VSQARRERKVVTVLFADLVGFTARSEQLDPEDVAAELGRYHARVREELERFGGTVEKFIGDAAMAIFGAPVAHEDDSERAVRAAFEILAWAADEGIDMRVGINAGEALVTVDARPEAGETMAAGDVVNTAARLQSAAPVNGVLVGVQAYRATERAIEYREAEPVEAKGKAEPVTAWEAVRPKSRIGVDRVHGATLVGRTGEVALLEDALARTLGERSPQLVTLVGVPGIGKSRLVLELYRAIERHPDLIAWRLGRCLPYGDGVTFWALGEVVKAQLGILEGDGELEAERKLSEAVSDTWVRGHLRPLVGLAGAVEASGTARDEAFTAWRRYLEGLADERPLVLVFEDLHWADDNLLDFVDHLVDWAGGVPLLVVGTARPELLTRRPGWGGGKLNALTISLSPLSDEETTRLLHELLGSVLDAETQLELLGRAGGNPLYAEEFVRMLRDRGRVGELPETVQGLIAARLDLLDPAQKGLLQDAATIGKRFWMGALASLTGVESSTLEARLHELERKEFVRRERVSSVIDEDEYAFRHLLVRDVGYAQIPRAERAEKHLQAAGWIEQLGRREDHAEMLAHHYLQALELTAAAGGSTTGFADRARAALADAGERAMALSAYDAATRFFGAALDLLPSGDPQRGRLSLRLGRARFLLGEPAVALLEAARDELVAAGDDEGATEAQLALAESLWMAGESELAVEAVERAQELSEGLGDTPTKARVVLLTSRLLFLGGRAEEALVYGENALALAAELGLADVRAAALVNVGTARATLGGSGWRTDLQEAAESARAANVPFDLVRGMGNAASWHWTWGELEEAVARWQEAHHIALDFGQIGFARWFRAVVVGPMLELGRWDEAVAAADEFIGEVEAGSPHYLAGQCYNARAYLRLARDDHHGALADAEESLELAERHSDPQAKYPSYAEAAFVLAELGQRDRALELAREFLGAVGSAQRLAGFETTSHHVLCWAMTAVGAADEAVTVLEAAATLDIPWTRAGVTFARGNPLVAAELLGGIGAVNSEAYCRLAAARAGNLSQLESALAFYRKVGATRFVREGESLLAASA
jgi:class 3 adenylate cyclase/tetratricopeptide (TPR) repeat protein